MLGIQTLSRVDFAGNRKLVIIAISVAAGMIPVAVPEFYANFPESAQIVFDSSITAASLTAILLNIAFNVLGKRATQPHSRRDRPVGRRGIEPPAVRNPATPR